MIASLFCGRKLASCATLGCMMRSFTPATSAAAGARQAIGAKGGEQLQSRKGQRHRPEIPAPASLISQSRRRGENSDGEKRQPVQADDRGRFAQARDSGRAPCRSRSREIRSARARAAIRSRTRPTASAKMRPAPGDHNNRAIAKPMAGKIARPAGSARTPKGSAQANLSASTRKAAPSHQRPATK